MACNASSGLREDASQLEEEGTCEGKESDKKREGGGAQFELPLVTVSSEFEEGRTPKQASSLSIEQTRLPLEVAYSTKKNRRQRKSSRGQPVGARQLKRVVQHRLDSVAENGSAVSLRPAMAPSPDVVLEQVDRSPYSSDAWEEDTDRSDTDGDHPDSSDDDNPKSQMDRLIEEGTIIYMEGENSALSSESDSDDSSVFEESDSDITDVSPLVSAAASPLVGLSPVMPRRSPMSPLPSKHHHPSRRHYNQDAEDGYADTEDNAPRRWSSPPQKEVNDMSLLFDAVLNLERNSERRCRKPPRHSRPSQLAPHPVHDSPHHGHLRRPCHRRKNMSFSNEEVRRIDRENSILLGKIMAVHSRSSAQDASFNRCPSKPSNASISRRREEEKIRKENLILLRKIQEAKATPELAV